MHGENQNLGSGVLLANLAGGIEAIQTGHADIDQHDVGREFLG